MQVMFCGCSTSLTCLPVAAVCLFVQSESGDIMFPSAVQGSVSVVSRAVAAEKRALGPSLDISSTDTGPISVASCYSDQSKFSTQTGDLSSSSELLTRYIYF